MSPSFAELVEEIRQRPLEEKDELLHVLQREIAEARRAELATHAEEARREYREGQLGFSTSIAELKRKTGR